MRRRDKPENRPGRARTFPGVLALSALVIGVLAVGSLPAGAAANDPGMSGRKVIDSVVKPGWLLAQDESEEAPTEGETQAEPAEEPSQGEAPQADTSQTGEDGGQTLPEIITDLNELPFPARKMRDLILEAAHSGDIEKLRPYLGYGDDVTMLSLGGHDEDPIEFLKSLSGDPDGHEILAIMTEILEAPPVKTEQVSGEAVYVWPYFYAYPFDKLTPEQRVDMYRIITHGDYEEMVQFGSYIFYRLGITPEGRWRFFVAGD